FYAVRKYLLHSLYHDLQDLSSAETTPLASAPDDDVELETLPTPSTAGGTPRESAFAPRKGAMHSTLSRALFALSFSESLMLFILLMCQALDLLHARTRLFNWKISLYILLISIVGVIPFSYSLVLSYRSAAGIRGLQKPTFARLGLFAVPIGVFLFLLSFIPVPTGAASSGITGSVLTRLTTVGTILLGSLSGFGAVDNASRFLPWFSRSNGFAPSDADILVAQEGLERIRGDLAERRRAIEQMQTSQVTDKSWFSRVVPSFVSGSELSGAMQEAVGLEALEYQMARNLSALRAQKREVEYSRTLAGRLGNWGGALFAVYCLYRIAIAAVNLVLPARTASPAESPDAQAASRADVITVCLAYLLALLPGVHAAPADVAVLARQISLALVGAIILSSIRLVLRGVARALRVTSRNLGASLMLLILAQLMGIYLLTTLIQLRTSFPPPPARPDTQADIGVINLFATLPEYQVFGSLFDGSFLLVAALSAIAQWFSHRINSVGVMDAS
ncbi:hypothetical protein PHLGIDRAFT_72510, partial [Phlebiopsis gigantea 11061_1 CR5-6]